MKNLFSSWKALPALLVALTAWACADAGQVLSPSGVSAEISSVNVGGTKYKLAKGKYDGKVREDRKEISGKGGRVEAGGHVLTVPEGAVSVPTLFVLRVLPPDTSTSSEYIKVELKAFERDADGKWTVNVGPRGFLKPVQLGLTYSWMTDKIDPALLTTAWVKPDGTGELRPSRLDAANLRVLSDLNHFSQYALAFP